MNKLLLLLFVMCCNSGIAQTTDNSYYNSDFKWKMDLPENFEKVPVAEWRKKQNQGKEAMEKTVGAEVDNQTSILFVLRSGDFNYLEANSQPFDTAKDGNYEESCKMVDSLLCATFKAQAPNATIETSTGKETIGGVEFLTFHLVMHITEQISFNCTMYNHLFGKKEFTVNVMYIDADKGKAMTAAWKASQFDK